MQASTITTKGQVTIPKNIRDLLKLDKGDRVEFVVNQDGIVTIEPIKNDVLKLKGMIAKPKQPVSLEDMKNAISEEGAKM